ncbi:phage tail tape measure protein [Actibacterium sp. XHP0104]|uniref:phage tail tape measure protein n=1 Tax=Actibacterium sp. XHP0104 TaxID=2984335 RepID=UPI0021E79F4B|nr:phage tail tape measure protein [Actibacterium sp. XHP0104]MCV2880984.1 phage tail tape measure protein [Actibacterium sp. XHP0104]
MKELDTFDDKVAALEENLAQGSAQARQFEAELTRMRESVTLTSREVATLSGAIGRGLRGAFEGLVFDGMKLSDALRDVAQSISAAAYNAAITPIQKELGGWIASGVEGIVGSMVPFAKGGAFTLGRVTPFATGGVVSGPTYFPMRGGTGLMGEAGPEAIMPLTRGPDGRLGVQSQGGGQPVHVTMNISTPDVRGFERSQSQIAAAMSRAISRGRRNS